MPPDDPKPIDPPPPTLQYARAPSEIDRRQYAQMTWKNDGRLGCFSTVAICFLLPALYCAAGNYLPHPAVALAGAAITIAGVGLYCGLKDGAWGFLSGVGVAMGIGLGLVLLVYSICGNW